MPLSPRRPDSRLPRTGRAALTLALIASAAWPQTPDAPAAADDAARPPVAVDEGIAVVGAADAVPDPRLGRRLVRIAFPETPAGPVLDPAATGPAASTLRTLVAEGRAASNHGDLYENRDGGHSLLPAAAHPQLTQVRWDASAEAEGLNYGLAGEALFDAPTLGNSSTALTSGPLWRSLPRSALASGAGARRLFQNYANGQIHVYPEHRDHDPDHGDLIPANTPYLVISQGSSGSDQPHLEALAMILAAFRPDTKAALVETGLLAPTVQMVYRRGQDAARTREGYLSGAAHPSVFTAEGLNPARMVALANAIAPDAIPPVVLLDVLKETLPVEGRDFFGAGLDERLFDTPSAIARVWRSSAPERTMVVSAAGSYDPNGRPLRFEWRLLRGDPERVHIEPLDAAGTAARITIGWQAPRPVPARPDIRSARVDIGVFADNGVHLSAPAFVSMLLPAHETRTYETGPDDTERTARIDYAPPEGVYADPAIFPRIDWRDDYDYGPDGTRLGWTRTRSDRTETYTPDGARVLTHDAAGAPTEVEPPRYALALGPEGLPHVTELPTGRVERR